MDYSEARQCAKRGSTVSLVTPDATGDLFVRHPCWIDEDDQLVMPHPTQDTGTVRAPADGNYRLD